MLTHELSWAATTNKSDMYNGYRKLFPMSLHGYILLPVVEGTGQQHHIAPIMPGELSHD